MPIFSTHAEAINLILKDRENTYLILGEPGIGKTSLGEQIAAAAGLPYVQIAAPSKSDPAEFGMQIPDRDQWKLRFMGNDTYKWDEPAVYNIDEITKASSGTKTFLSGLADKPRRIGDVLIHPKSIIYQTGNLNSDGVGDSQPKNITNRVVTIILGKPSQKAMVAHGYEAGWSSMVLGWISTTEGIMASYLDSDFDGETNRIVFNPRKTTMDVIQAFVSPRALGALDKTVKIYESVDERGQPELTTREMRIAAQGHVGEFAANSFMSFMQAGKTIPQPRDIVERPYGCDIPDGPAGQAMVALNATKWLLRAVDGTQSFEKPDSKYGDPFLPHEVVNKWYTYMGRLEPEARALFWMMAAAPLKDKKGKPLRDGTKSTLHNYLVSSDSYNKFVDENGYLIELVDK
jgi:hypothetical protein